MFKGEYCQVLDSVICLKAIKKIYIRYFNGTNYGNNFIHTIWITYMNDKVEEFSTSDIKQAKYDFENLRNVLLGNSTNEAKESKDIE